MKKMSSEEKNELFSELSGEKEIIRKSARVGTNQGQCFVRIPKRISEEMGIISGMELEFVLTKENEKKELKVGILK